MESTKIAIAHPERPTEPVIIDAADFDPKRHVRWEIRQAEIADTARSDAERQAMADKQQRINAAMAVPLEERRRQAAALVAASQPQPPAAYGVMEHSIPSESADE